MFCSIDCDQRSKFFSYLGGLPGKFVGRIGDASLIGCGGYANNKGAAATTGNGEIIMKMTLARQVIYNIENQMGAQVRSEYLSFIFVQSRYIEIKNMN